MKKAFCFFYVLLTVCCGTVLGGIGYFCAAVPERVSVVQGQTFCVGTWVQSRTLPMGDAVPAAKAAGEQYRARLTLAGLFPLKDVTVTVTAQRTLMVCGTPFGVKMFTDGVLVVGLSDVSTALGRVNPATAAGVQVGDVIVAVNGETATSSKQLSRLIEGCKGERLAIRVRRDGVEFDAVLTPARTAEGYRVGMWIRDSAAGVGMLTFYDPVTGVFGGLGHAVYDVDTGRAMPLGSGEVVPARIFGIVRSEPGIPGELQGGFEPGRLGTLLSNGEQGLYGVLSVYPVGAVSLPLAERRQVEKGAAQILCTLDGIRPRYYDVVIEQVKPNSRSANRHMIVRVTDPDLLTLTGGIVQGMSGSPILQNGKLIGAVTHVLVDDPTKGYAIFAENMLETAQIVAEEQQLKDAS